MRLPDILSALTLNVVLALFSMIMAIFALGLLAFVLAKENQTARAEASRFHPRDKIRRHESTIVDFSKPSTVPDHFLQLNTLMFQKKKNNQIKQVATPIQIEGMDTMMSSIDEEQFSNRALPPLPGEILRNQVENSADRRRARRSDSSSDDEPITITTTMSSSTDSSSEGEVDSISTQSTEATSSIADVSLETSSTSTTTTTFHESLTAEKPKSTEEWIEEKSTIEPLARKVVLELDCGSEFSLC